MTTPAERIKEVLASHWLDRDMQCMSQDHEMARVFFDTGDDHVAHQVAVIEKLPDIAIVELPDGEINWEITDWDGGRVSIAYGSSSIRCYVPNPSLSVEEARQLGVALLAAARALGGGS